MLPSMKSTLGLSALALAMAPLPASAWEPLFDRPTMIEVGAGVAAGTESPVEALFRVNLTGGTRLGDTSYFIVARVSGDFTAGESGVSYIDMQFEAVGYERRLDEFTFWGVNLVGANVNRNVAIDNEVSAQITFLGVRGGVGGQVADNVAMYVRGAADLIGIGITERRSDGAGSVGAGMTLSAELGVKLYNRVRIALGEKFGTTLGKPESVYVGTTCDTWYDDYGYPHRHCYDDYDTYYNDRRFTSNTYVSLVFDLTENLSLFGQAAYNVYVVHDHTGGATDSIDGAFQFLFGMTGRF